MSKFDRGVFIFIGLGIWALAMTQVFDSKEVVASYTTKTPYATHVHGKCPPFIYNSIQGPNLQPAEVPCNYILVATRQDLFSNPGYYE